MKKKSIKDFIPKNKLNLEHENELERAKKVKLIGIKCWLE